MFYEVTLSQFYLYTYVTIDHVYGSTIINMAARSLVLNSSLCFLIDKYGKLTSKSLKRVYGHFGSKTLRQ